ncbi:MAG: hypothetical protein U9N30_05715 [Campylobacterota bacterium]|nr:hypothetical protein [Campylobacterota bacterium]
MRHSRKAIDKILEDYRCNCYIYDKKGLVLNRKRDCDKQEDLNAAVSKLTGFLIMNDIEYEMTPQYDIIISGSQIKSNE